MMSVLPMPLQPVASMKVEERAAPRFTLLIRAAKIIIEDREYLCVARDISASGAKVRTFHPIEEGKRLALEFQPGQRHPVDMVWQANSEAGFQFHGAITVDDILNGYSDLPRRDLRFAFDLPAVLGCGGTRTEVRLLNLSRQGGAIESDMALLLDQPVQLEVGGMPEVEARVRWRKDGRYGLVFNRIFSIGDLASIIRNLHRRSQVEQRFGESRHRLPQTAYATA